MKKVGINSDFLCYNNYNKHLNLLLYWWDGENVFIKQVELGRSFEYRTNTKVGVTSPLYHLTGKWARMVEKSQKLFPSCVVCRRCRRSSVLSSRGGRPVILCPVSRAGVVGGISLPPPPPCPTGATVWKLNADVSGRAQRRRTRPAN